MMDVIFGNTIYFRQNNQIIFVHLINLQFTIEDFRCMFSKQSSYYYLDYHHGFSSTPPSCMEYALQKPLEPNTLAN